jgi:hypothetical protein
MNKYCVYLTDGRVAFVTAIFFDWGASPDSKDMYFYGEDDCVVAWFSTAYVIGVDTVESEADTNEV